MDYEIKRRIIHMQELARFYRDLAIQSRLYYEWLKRGHWTIAEAKERQTFIDHAETSALYSRDARVLLMEWLGE